MSEAVHVLPDAVEYQAYTAIENVMIQLNTGIIDPCTAELMLNVVFNSFNIIIGDRAFLEMIDACRAEIVKIHQPVVTRSYILTKSDLKAIVIIIDCMVSVQLPKKPISKIKCETPAEAYQKAMAMIVKLQTNGFELRRQPV